VQQPVNRIWYSVRQIAPPPLAVRAPHRMQSKEAARLLGSLSVQIRDDLTAQSIAHSRALVAAVATSASGISLGIDLEFVDDTRHLQGLAQALGWAAPKNIDTAAFYRGWCFYEAYFKAFQTRPRPRQVARVMARKRRRAPWRLEKDIYLLERLYFRSFQLTIVWHGLPTVARPICFSSPFGIRDRNRVD